MKREDLIKLAASFLIVIIVAIMGSLVEIDKAWYESVKPSITPPDIVFPIVWTILYILIAISLFLVWRDSKRMNMDIYTTYGSNLVLNVLWIWAFFGLRSPKIALWEAIFLWLTIIGMIYTASKINKTAAWLLIPYFLWVSFAIVITYLAAYG